MKIKYVFFIIITILFLLISPIVYVFSTDTSISTLKEAAESSTSHGIDITSVKKIYWMKVNKPYEIAKEISYSTYPNSKDESGFLLIIEGNAVVAPGYASNNKSAEPYYIAEILFKDKKNSTTATKSIDIKIISKYGELHKLGNPWATLLWIILKR